MKSVWFESPTANWPCSPTAIEADRARGLHRGGVDAAVDEAPGLVMVRAGVDVARDLLAGHGIEDEPRAADEGARGVERGVGERRGHGPATVAEARARQPRAR